MHTDLHIKGNINSEFLLMISLVRPMCLRMCSDPRGVKASAAGKTRAGVKAVFSKPNL